MQYSVSDMERSSLIRTVCDWLEGERKIFAVFVDSIRGRGNSKTETQRGEFDAELLADVPSAEYLVDQTVETFGDFGGKMQLRVCFLDDEGKADWEHQQRKRFTLKGETPGARTGSSGQAAATEALSQSLSKGFDNMTARLDDAQERTLSAMRDGGDRSERFFERLLELQAVGSNTTTAQAIALQEQIARANFAEFKLELVQANQESSLGSLLVEAMPLLIQSPLLGNLADLVGAYASRVAVPDAAPLPPEVPEPPPTIPESADQGSTLL